MSNSYLPMTYVQFIKINQSKHYDPLHLPNFRKVSSKDMSSARDLFFSRIKTKQNKTAMS